MSPPPCATPGLLSRLLPAAVIVVVAGVAVPGWRWYRRATAGDTPYDEVGIGLNAWMPRPLHDWPCGRVAQRLQGTVPPHGCAPPGPGEAREREAGGMTEFGGATRRTLLTACLGLALPGCDDEASQRKAFIAFLQTRILDRPGVHVPRPTAEEGKAWGDYAGHYAIITGFNDALSERVSQPMQAAVQRGAVRSLQEVLDRRSDLRTVVQSIDGLVGELNRQLAQAEAARAALSQPADLKPVFDAAFERDVAGPARAFLEALPVAQDALAKAVSLADLLDGNRARVRLDGVMVQVSDPALQREVQARMSAMNEAAQRTQAAQRRLQALITGS